MVFGSCMALQKWVFSFTLKLSTVLAVFTLWGLLLHTTRAAQQNAQSSYDFKDKAAVKGVACQPSAASAWIVGL